MHGLSPAKLPDLAAIRAGGRHASFRRVSAPAIRTHIRSGHQSHWSRSALATCGQMRA
jgi:hypothetical protein